METPDFERIAREIVSEESWQDTEDGRRDRIAAQLRQVWNSRGAADMSKLESELSTLMGSTKAGPYVKNLDRAIRSLDR